MVNMNLSSIDDLEPDTPKGITVMTQRMRSNGRISPLYMRSNWANLEKNKKY